ncbi:MAG: hypothetical protein M0Z55_06260 [Peptococcaceae bacterium]|nr:hypothetical protein [Peptococcaceae bacterium]
MLRNLGPIHPLSPHPNGYQSYICNPEEDLPVAEDTLSPQNFAAAYCTEPVFSAQAIYGFEHKPQSYNNNKPED